MAGHALRLNSSTEKTTPKPRPREDLIRRLERQRSHYLQFGALVLKGLSFLLLVRSLSGVTRCVASGDDGLSLGHGLTFSFRSASLTGRETVLGGGGGTDVSAIVTCGTDRWKREPINPCFKASLMDSPRTGMWIERVLGLDMTLGLDSLSALPACFRSRQLTWQGGSCRASQG